MNPLHVLAFVGGTAVIVATCLSAVRSVVLPRGDQARMTRVVFTVVRTAFEGVARLRPGYEYRDRVMARFAPIALLSMTANWVFVVLVAGTFVFWGMGVGSWHTAFQLSGSSLTTLGFTQATSEWAHVAAVIEAVIGLGLVALLISYLATVYSSFQRRELAVSLLEVRAGDPPSAVKMLLRHAYIARADAAVELFVNWEQWFADIEETHTSQPGLAYFRSPLPGRSWITASGAVLDAAALVMSAVDVPRLPEPQLCIRAGFLSLRRIAATFDIAFDPDPSPDDPISVTRAEFDAACQELVDGGVPVKSDREQAWRDFSGWRVNYDSVLVAIADKLHAPYAPWSSDRSALNR